MNKKIKTIVRITALIILSALVGLSIYSTNVARLNGDALPMPLGFGMTVVLSGSMEPELSVGDVLIVVKDTNYSEGEVIVFQTGRTAVVHRIVSIDGDSIVTQGDANNVVDDPISFSNVKGRVLFSIPYAGYVINLIKTPIGTVILLGLALWLLEASFKKDKKKETEEIDAIKAEIEKLKNEQN